MVEQHEDLLVIAAMGKDRPGIVDEFTEFILERNCNLEDSRMAALGGEFAFVVLVSGSSESIQRVANDMEQFASRVNLQMSSRATTRASCQQHANRVPYRLTGTGMDHPGVVHRFSHLLHQQGINIANMDSHSYNAPVSGTPLFHFDMVIEVPASVSVAGLRGALTELADQENMDVHLAPVVVD